MECNYSLGPTGLHVSRLVGDTVLDYALAHVDALPDIKSFKVGAKHLELDHLPLWLTLGVHAGTDTQKITANSGGFWVDQEKQKEYANTLDTKLNTMAITPTWGALKEAILDTTTKVFGAVPQVR